MPEPRACRTELSVEWLATEHEELQRQVDVIRAEECAQVRRGDLQCSDGVVTDKGLREPIRLRRYWPRRSPRCHR